MINAATTPRHLTAAAGADAEQLSLLPNESVTARFRLSRDTRERGLRHVAEIRALLAERAEQAQVTTITSLPAAHAGHGDRAA
ncbi:MAG: hypothetical protein WBP59_11900 [Ilumatobacteraceae bacterium]